MTLTTVLMLLKKKPAVWTLIGIAIAFIGLPVISSLVPCILYDKVEAGSYFDVVDMKEISWLSVQRLNFSKLVTATRPKDATLGKADAYLRRIARGHVTTSLNFSEIAITNSPEGIFYVKFPPLNTKSIIDEWIFYASKGTDKDNSGALAAEIDKEVRKQMEEDALKPERVARAKKQAEEIVKMLYDMQDKEKFVFQWPQ